MSNQQQDATKFEFLLTLDNNIICQRFFNVRDFNKKSTSSEELYEYVSNICYDISSDIKRNDFLYLTDPQRNYETNNENQENIDNSKGLNYLLEIKTLDRMVICRTFPANVYHPKMRYTVDIRHRLKDIISDLTFILSSRKLTNKFKKYDLV